MTWARTFGSEYIYKNNDIKYLEGTLGLNVGIDVYTDYNKNNLAGVYFGYSNSTKKVGTQKTEKQIGTVKTDMFAFGFTDTFENNNVYVDTVLQVAALKNRYNLNSKEISNTGIIVKNWQINLKLLWLTRLICFMKMKSMMNLKNLSRKKV